MIADTRRRLTEWGNWSRGGIPSLSSMFRAITGRGGSNNVPMPAHIQEIDIVVCRAEPQTRIILIKYYTGHGSQRERAQSLGLSRTTLMRRLEHAEWYVNSEIDNNGPQPVDSKATCGF
jgi:hypothetical protein